MKFHKVILWVTVLGLMNPGCAVFKTEEYEKDDNGNYLNHYNSCGPKALEKAFAAYNQKNGIHNARSVSREELSRVIQEDGPSIRMFLSFFHYDALMITTPNEIKQACKKYGYDVISLNSLKKIDYDKDVAIVLVFGSILEQEAHWLCIPVDNSPEGYFGEHTKISKIYLLKKK
jgi:hypothetical protein